MNTLRSVPTLVGPLISIALVLGGCGAQEAASDSTPVAVESPAPVPSPAPTATPVPPRCVGGLSVERGYTDAAMGLRAMPLLLRNCGDEPVTVEGFPVLGVLDIDREPIAVTVTEGTDSIEAPGPAPVTIAPGDAAVAVVVWRSLVEDGDVAVGEYLEVAPVDGEPVQVVVPDGPVDLGTTRAVEVTAWAPHDG